MAENEVTEHEPGTMDIRAHEKMFASFVRFATWVCVLAGVVLIFLALTNA
ncbi:aa3-type cytochrome c oxidase subunit IV [Paracoccus sp. SCSIO 75233]|nr:aa3-type cytochrome c oxidase subunit IV [Paracoccus sp. SCSIO 75233]WBU53172.1 aa3-type cytochrome c oxidase subunit IV [Paracoccus sp. SCSIO 75233]